jgi:hypothetical protein
MCFTTLLTSFRHPSTLNLEIYAKSNGQAMQIQEGLFIMVAYTNIRSISLGL